MKYRRSLFLFRRDLRLDDNSGLIFALENSEEVVPAFIFTPEQIDCNPLRNPHCLQFMLASLEDLEGQLKKWKGKLYYFHGRPDKVVKKCIDKLDIDALIVNRDYTPYSKQRDGKLEKLCKSRRIDFYSFDDALLHAPEETVKKDGKPYLIFTPYFRHASKLKVPKPIANRRDNYFQGAIAFTAGKPPIKPSSKGGRTEALKLLKSLSRFRKYAKLRDYPSLDFTTHLSAHLKFTTISPREVYHRLSKGHALVRALYWRDFFTGIAHFFPHVFDRAFYPKFDSLPWSYDKKTFRRWCEGKTGFPIVDAGMREMNATGYMHNRVRMIAAQFLVKDLHIDWRWGEKYFAKTLVDYDPAVNNGNWQWAASTGCDAQPYFRIFNSWSQQEKFDPDCAYIKKWIPELKKLPPKTIHAWQGEKGCSYPPPMVDHGKEAKKALATYRRVAKR